MGLIEEAYDDNWELDYTLPLNEGGVFAVEYRLGECQEMFDDLTTYHDALAKAYRHLKRSKSAASNRHAVQIAPMVTVCGAQASAMGFKIMRLHGLLENQDTEPSLDIPRNPAGPQQGEEHDDEDELAADPK